jgi:hypothetical protein
VHPSLDPHPGTSDREADNCGLLKLSEGDDEIPIPFAAVMRGRLSASTVSPRRDLSGHKCQTDRAPMLIGTPLPVKLSVFKVLGPLLWIR